MMQITTVQGNVLVEDRKKGYTEMARSGMTLDALGDYLIATTPTSRAQLMVNGQTVELPPSSFLRIGRGRTLSERHNESWTGDVKLFVGKIWARLARDYPDLGSGGGGGIRG